MSKPLMNCDGMKRGLVMLSKKIVRISLIQNIVWAMAAILI